MVLGKGVDVAATDPPAPPRWGRAWTWAAMFPAIAASSAIVLVPVPPFLDVPWHIAWASVEVGHASVPAFSTFYSLNHEFGPNTLAHAVAAASGHPRAAIVGLTLFALLGSAAMLLALARRFRTGPIFPLIAGPFVIHHTLVFGFVEFDSGVPLLLALVWWLASVPTTRGAMRWLAWTAVLAALLQTLFFAHAILCIFAMLIVARFAARLAPRRPSIAIASALAALPTVASLAAWKLGRHEDRGQAQWLRWYYELGYFQEFRERLRDVFVGDHGWLIGTTAGPCIACATVGVTLIAVGVVWSRRPSRRTDDDAPAAAAAAAFCVAAALTVLLAPPGLPPFWYVYQRFIASLFVSLALFVSVDAGRTLAPRWLASVLVAVNVLIGAAWFEHIWSFGRISGDLIALAETTPLEGVGAYLIADMRWRNDPLALMHAADLMTAYGHVPVQSAMYDFPHTRIRRGPGLAAMPWREPYFQTVVQLEAQVHAFGWVLVHRSIPKTDRTALLAFADERARRGDWTIYTMRPTTRPSITGTGP